MIDDVLLRTQTVTKFFSGFVAVKGISLDVKRGAIHALIGPNGADKTAYFNLLIRFMPVTSGRISFKGRDITRANPHDVARMGHRAFVPDLGGVPAPHGSRKSVASHHGDAAWRHFGPKAPMTKSRRTPP